MIKMTFWLRIGFKTVAAGTVVLKACVVFAVEHHKNQSSPSQLKPFDLRIGLVMVLSSCVVDSLLQWFCVIDELCTYEKINDKHVTKTNGRCILYAVSLFLIVDLPGRFEWLLAAGDIVLTVL